MRPRGELVAINFNASTAVGSSTLTLYDANGNVRPLAAYERLVIFNLTGFAAAGAGQVDVYAPSTSTASTAAAGTFLLSYIQAGYVSAFPEGRPCELGVLPKVTAPSTGTVTVTGTGGIVQDKTQGVRPNWRESLNGGFAIQP